MRQLRDLWDNLLLMWEDWRHRNDPIDFGRVYAGQVFTVAVEMSMGATAAALPPAPVRPALPAPAGPRHASDQTAAPHNHQGRHRK